MAPRTSLTLSFLASAALIASAVAAQPVAEGGRKLTTTLTGAAEVTAAGVFNQGDPDGTGTARIIVNPGQRRICYELTVGNIATPTAAHIHEAPRTAPGPVVAPLGTPTGGSSSGCVDVTRQLALEILKDPADYYVNVHNATYPAGAVRGQLAK